VSVSHCAIKGGPSILLQPAVHILEYENYAGYDKTVELIKNSEVVPLTSFCSFMVLIPLQHAKYYKALLPYITSRSAQLAQEFAFFPTAPPHAQGGVFELRSYQLKPGTLLEWENTWCASYSSPRIIFRD
jgi:hypothetical protein